MGSDDPLENGWKTKKRKHAKKSSFLCLCYIFESNQAGRRTALCWPHIYLDILQNALFRSQIFTSFFASGRQAARGIDPLTKILRTFLMLWRFCYASSVTQTFWSAAWRRVCTCCCCGLYNRLQSVLFALWFWPTYLPTALKPIHTGTPDTTETGPSCRVRRAVWVGH